MLIAIISILLILYAIYLFRRPDGKGLFKNRPKMQYLLQVGLFLFGIFGILSRSFIVVDPNEVGHLNRVYMAADLPAGKIIAPHDEKGHSRKSSGQVFT